MFGKVTEFKRVTHQFKVFENVCESRRTSKLSLTAFFRLQNGSLVRRVNIERRKLSLNTRDSTAIDCQKNAEAKSVNKNTNNLGHDNLNVTHDN